MVVLCCLCVLQILLFSVSFFFLFIFAFFYRYFEEHIFLILMKSNLSFPPFLDHPFGVKSKLRTLVLYHKYFSYFIFLIVLHLILWPMISLFLYKLWGLGLGSVFCLWMSASFSIICWEGHLSSIKLFYTLSNQLGIYVWIYEGARNYFLEGRPLAVQVSPRWVF